jgi:hypothetical protein
MDHTNGKGTVADSCPRDLDNDLFWEQATYELYEKIQEKIGQPGKKVQPLPGEFDE